MRLYLVTRQDLDPGSQAVQSCRALMQFNCDHPDFGRRWFLFSGELAMTTTTDELALKVLLQTARDKDIRVSSHHAGAPRAELVAVVLESSAKVKRLVARLRPID